MHITNRAYLKQYLLDDSVANIQNNNKAKIQDIIETFKRTNGLSNEDFIILGSSAACYMDYMVLKSIKDVDVVLLTKKEVEKTKQIDILTVDPSALTVVIKDGYQFISQENFLITSTIQALCKYKRSNMLYTRLMCIDMNLTVNEFENLILEKVTPFICGSSEDREKRRTMISDRLSFLTNRYSDNDFEYERKRLQKFINNEIEKGET